MQIVQEHSKGFEVHPLPKSHYQQQRQKESIVPRLTITHVLLEESPRATGLHQSRVSRKVLKVPPDHP